jgi:hypothetical protein
MDSVYIRQRRNAFNFDTAYEYLDDEDRGKKALFLGECLEDAGDESEAMKWYRTIWNC